MDILSMTSTNLIHFKIATALNHLHGGHAERAEFELGHLLIQHPGNPGILAALANTYYFLCDFNKTVTYTKSAESTLTATASQVDVLYVSKMMRCIGEDEMANQLAYRCISEAKNDPHKLSRLADHFMSLDLVSESVQMYRDAGISALDTYQMAMYGTALLYTSDVEAAKCHFKIALDRDPDNYEAALQLSMLNVPEGRKKRITDWENIANSCEDPTIRSQWFFALFNEYDAEKRSDLAINALRIANDLRASATPYNPELETAAVDRYLERLNGIDFKELAITGANNAAPVFIFGLPRTGTTLLEKTLTHLADLNAVGEHLNFRKSIECQLGYFFTSPYEISNCDFGEILDFGKLGQRYLEKTAWRADGHAYYTDKEPFNFVYAGIIAIALPEARILHVRRNPMDACFSAYKQSFAPGSYPASYGLDSLASYYRNYARVMAFWREALGERMLEICYEDLVLRHDETVARIKAYCRFGDAEPAAAVRPYKASTLSAAQVQKPIHAGNINAWAKYAEYLKPLRQALDAEYTAYMAEIEGVQIL